MRKQNVLQKKHLHLYSIQISSTPKTSSYSMRNILKWKSRASEHEVGRWKYNFHLQRTFQLNSTTTICYVPCPTLATSQLKTCWRCGPCPPGSSDLHAEAGHRERSLRSTRARWAHTGLFSPPPPPAENDLVQNIYSTKIGKFCSSDVWKTDSAIL